MKKLNIKPIIMSALSALALGVVTVGTTFALFTDKAETTISVDSGKVDINLVVSEATLTSADANAATKTMTDENGAEYGVQTGWVNGGSATSQNNVITLSKMTPGDKAEFDLTASNASNVNIKYRYYVYAVDKTDKLVEALEVSIGGESYVGLTKYYSAWKYASAGANLAEAASDFDKLSFFMPITTGNDYQDLETEYVVGIEAVQGNAYTTDPAVIETTAQSINSYDEMSGQAIASDADLVISASSPDQAVAITATIPAAANEISEGDEVTLSISQVSQVTVSSTNTLKVDFDVTLKVNEQVVSSFSEPIKIELNVGPNRDIASITHHTTGGDVAITEYSYNSTSGIVTFYSQSFSPFTVEYYDIPDSSIYPVRIGKVGYATLQAAVDAVPTNGVETTVIVEESLTNNTLAVNQNKNVKIDLRGHKLSYTGVARYSIRYNGSSRNAYGDIFVNEGATLKIENGDLSLYCRSSNALACMLWNGGTLVINDCDCSASGEAYPGYSSIYGHVLTNMNRATATLSGKFECDTGVHTITNGSGAVAANVTANLIVTGQNTLISSVDHDAIDNFGNVTVYDGTIQGGTSDDTAPVHAINSHNPGDGIAVNVYGGKLFAGEGVNDTPYSEECGHNNIYGGTFNFEPKDVENHTFINGAVIDNGDGTWSVEKQVWTYHVTAEGNNNYREDQFHNVEQVAESWSDILGDGDYPEGWELNSVSGKYEERESGGLLKEGDTIYFANGTYNNLSGKLYSAPGVTIIGESQEGTIIELPEGLHAHGDLTIKNVTFGSSSGTKWIVQPNIVGLNSETTPTHVNARAEMDYDFYFENVTFNYYQESQKNYGPYMAPKGDLTVKNCKFENLRNGICGVTSADGKNTIVIIGNTFTNIKDETIGYNRSAYLTDAVAAQWASENTFDATSANKIIGYGD